MDKKDTIMKSKYGGNFTYLDMVYLNAYDGCWDNAVERTSIVKIEPIVDGNGNLSYDKTFEKLKELGENIINEELEVAYNEQCHDMEWTILQVCDKDEYYGIFIGGGEYSDRVGHLEKITITDWSYLLNNREDGDWDEYISEKLNSDVDDFWNWYKEYSNSKMQKNQNKTLDLD